MPKYLDETGLAHYHGNVEKRPVQTFETVAAMQAAEWLKTGMTCHTNGFHASGDGGAAYYTVSTSGTANGMDVLALQGGMFATLVVTKPYVTPEQFGAYGDGTHDDTAAIQAAINSDTERVSLMGSTYRIGGRLGFRSDMTLVGSDGAKLMWDTLDGDNALLSGQSLHGITIDRVYFDFGTQSVLRYSVSLIDSYDINVKGCTFTGGYGYAWRINNDYDVLFEECAFNAITGATGNPGGGVFGSDFHDVTFERCSCDTIDDHLVYIAGTTEAYNVRVNGCFCLKTGQNGLTNGAAVCVYANAHDVIITGNIMKQCRTGVYVGKYGDYTTVPRNVTIADNTMLNIDQNGINLEGIANGANVMNVHVSSNTIFYCSQDAIKMTCAAYSTCDSNIIAYPTRYGIALDYCAYCTFTGGVISNVTNTALIVGTGSKACIYCKFDNIFMSQRTGTYSSYGLYSRQANWCEYVNLKAINFQTNYIYGGGGFNTYINAQDRDATKSIYFTTDITKADYHNVGDVVLNAAPTSGQPVMWICTAAGAPGTMTPVVTVP